MIRKRFLFPIIIIGILSIIACIIIGYSVWILSTTVDTPSKDLTKELIYTIHNAQTVTYNGEMQLPSHEVFGIEDSDLFSINDIIRYEYRLKDSTESYSQIPRENLSNTYTYNINGTTLAPGPLNAGIYDIKIVYDKDRTDLIKEEETEPLTFTIKPKQVEITWTNTVLIYNGVNQSPTPTITNLVVGDTCDIVLSNEECINVGSYEKEVTNITNPNYTIVDCTNLKTNFSIDRKSINNAEVKLNSPYIYIYIYIYKGSEITPEIESIKVDNLTLNTGDYEVRYEDNINASSNAKVIITGIGNFKDTKEVTFTIEPKSINGATFDISDYNYTYDRTEQKPSVSNVVLDSANLDSANYDVSYQNNINAGTATVTITGKGNYKDTATRTFTINKATISNVTIDSNTYTYNTLEQRPSVTLVTTTNNVILNSTEYKIVYQNNINAGNNALVKITSINSNFDGTVDKYFTINKAIATINTPQFSKTEYYEFENPMPTNQITVVSNGVILNNATITSNLNEFRFTPSTNSAFQDITIIYSFQDPNYEPISSNPVVLKVKPMCYIIQDKYYGSLKRCLDETISGQIVSFIPPTDNDYDKNNLVNSTNKVEYIINESCTIKEGVTLIVPTGLNKISSVTNSTTLNDYLEKMYKDQRDKANGTDYSSYRSLAKKNQNRYLRTSIFVNDNVSIFNNGTLVIAGYLSSGDGSSQGMISHTSHSYSRIVLGTNSKIIQNNNNSIMHCYGYIEEQSINNASTVEISKGILYLPFIVADYKGFNMSWAMTVDAINTHHCSPFNIIEFLNIETNFILRYAASLIGRVNMHIKYKSDFANVDESFPKNVNVLGNSNQYFLQLTDQNNSYVYSKLDVSNNKLKLNIYGGATLNPLSLTFEKNPVRVDLSTNNAYFPLSYFYDVDCYKTSNQTSALYNFTNQKIKLLPGSKLKLNTGCNIQSDEIIAYSAFLDSSTFNANEEITSKQGISYPIHKGAEFIIADGASLNANKIAGTVYCNSQNSINATITNMFVKEPWKQGNNPNFSVFGSSSFWTISNFLEIHEELQIVPLSNLDMNKVYIGNNIFTSHSAYKANFDISINESYLFNVNGTQKVIFMENISQYSVDFKDNIYKFFKQKNQSSLEMMSYSETVLVNSDTIIGAVSSTIPISSTNGSINEYLVQSITIECITPLVNNEIPLHVGKTISLHANVIDIDKVYNKNITWHSSDMNIATVDQSGKVNGISEGEFTVTATCMGVTASIQLEVRPEVSIPSISTIILKFGNETINFPNLPNNIDSTAIEIKNNVNQVVTVEFDAPWSSISWQFKGTGEARNYMTLENDSQSITQASNVEKVRIRTTNESTGTDPDVLSLILTVTDMNNNVFTRKIIFSHNYFKTCITKDSLITLYDGSTKRIDQLTGNEQLLVWNHLTGQFENANIAYIICHDEFDVDHLIVKLNFENGLYVKIIEEHIFFDATLNEYVAITPSNYQNYIGHEFIIFDNNGNINTTILNNVETYIEKTRSFEVVTYKHLSCITNNVISVTGYVVDLLNIFEFEKDLYTYDIDQMNKDIEKYGLYTYDDFKHLIDENVFEMYNAAYLKVAVGKGYITWNDIENLIDLYYSLNIIPLC